MRKPFGGAHAPTNEHKGQCELCGQWCRIPAGLHLVEDHKTHGLALTCKDCFERERAILVARTLMDDTERITDG